MAAKAFKSLILGGGVAAMFRSCTIHNLFLTAPKPYRICHFAEIALQSTVATRSRHISTIGISRAAETNPFLENEAFCKYSSRLDDLNDNRERIREASTYIKILSLRVMDDIGRITIHDRDEILKQAENDLAVIVDQHMSRLLKELQGTNFWMLREDYYREIQMYVGAVTLCYFCKTGALLNLDEINATLRPLSDSSIEVLKISVPDYLIGLANMAVKLEWMEYLRVINRESESAKKIFLGLTCVVSKMREFHVLMGLDTISECVKDIEYVLQGSESEIEEEEYEIEEEESENQERTLALESSSWVRPVGSANLTLKFRWFEL